jgi:hypothetical protein
VPHRISRPSVSTAPPIAANPRQRPKIRMDGWASRVPASMIVGHGVSQVIRSKA